MFTPPTPRVTRPTTVTCTPSPHRLRPRRNHRRRCHSPWAKPFYLSRAYKITPRASSFIFSATAVTPVPRFALTLFALAPPQFHHLQPLPLLEELPSCVIASIGIARSWSPLANAWSPLPAAGTCFPPFASELHRSPLLWLAMIAIVQPRFPVGHALLVIIVQLKYA